MMADGDPLPARPAGFDVVNVHNGSQDLWAAGATVQVNHLRRHGDRDTVCGLSLHPTFDDHGRPVTGPDLPGWSIGGGVSGPGVDQQPCGTCWQAVVDDDRERVYHAEESVPCNLASCDQMLPPWEKAGQPPLYCCPSHRNMAWQGYTTRGLARRRQVRRRNMIHASFSDAEHDDIAARAAVDGVSPHMWCRKVILDRLDGER